MIAVLLIVGMLLPNVLVVFWLIVTDDVTLTERGENYAGIVMASVIGLLLVIMLGAIGALETSGL